MKKSSGNNKVSRGRFKPGIVFGVVGLFLIVGIGVYLLSVNWSRGLVKDQAVMLDGEEPEVVVFEKRESWGPCPGEQECFQNVSLKDSGELVLRGRVNEERTLDYDSVMEVIEEIKESEIMFEDCEADEVTDYTATYTLRIGGMEKVIEYPGCEDKLEEIEDKLLDD